MPGAHVKALTQDLNLKTAHLTQSDHLVFVGGTNDLDISKNNIQCTVNNQDLINVLSQSLHTRVSIATVLDRYDHPKANEVIRQ